MTNEELVDELMMFAATASHPGGTREDLERRRRRMQELRSAVLGRMRDEEEQTNCSGEDFLRWLAAVREHYVGVQRPVINARKRAAVLNLSDEIAASASCLCALSQTAGDATVTYVHPDCPVHGGTT